MPIHILEENFHSYTLHTRGFSAGTVRRNRNALQLFINHCHISEIEEVSADILRRWMFEGRKARNWSPATCRTYHKSLKVFFDWCVREKHLPQNPAVGMELPKKAQKIPGKLTRQDASRLLEVAYNSPSPNRFVRIRNHAILATFIFAGLRKNELLRLKFTDVDLANLALFISCGKGAKDRVVPIPAVLAGILQTYAAERLKARKTCPEFFTSWRDNDAVSPTSMRGLVRDLKKASGIAFYPHMLRHTFATLMLEGGCDIYSLSKMMGHSDIKTTTIYLAASVDHLRSEMRKHPLNS
jgi:site-specific recombinase XerD